MSKYQEWLKAKELSGEKYCSGCETYKHTSEFCSDVSKSSGLSTKCKTCGAMDNVKWRKENPEKVREQKKKFHLENPHKKREYKRRSKYPGYTKEHENTMSCEICKIDLVAGCKSGNAQCIDHDHSTNKIRGVLCSHCNRGLGIFKDNPEILREAARYLEERTS